MKVTTHPYVSGKKALCFLDMPSLKCKDLFVKVNNEENIYISCLEDKAFKAKFYKCEIASTPYILALLCKICSFDDFIFLDEGFLSAESCFSEEEGAEIIDFLREAEYIIFDKNLKFHKDYENIKFFLAFLAKKFNLYISSSEDLEETLEISDKFHSLKNLDIYDGLVVFRSDSKSKFLHVSKQFLQITKLRNKSEVIFKTPLFESQVQIMLDEKLQGTIAFFDFKEEGYDFLVLQIISL